MPARHVLAVVHSRSVNCGERRQNKSSRSMRLQSRKRQKCKFWLGERRVARIPPVHAAARNTEAAKIEHGRQKGEAGRVTVSCTPGVIWISPGDTFDFQDEGDTEINPITKSSCWAAAAATASV